MRRPENNQQRPNQAHSGANHSLSFIPADQSRLLDWVDSERITFWCWLFIRSASCAFLGKQIADLQDSDIPYKFFEVSSNPSTHDERLC